MRIQKAGVLFLTLLLSSGCAHQWPLEGRGGLAERDVARDPAIGEAVQAVGYLQQSPGIRSSSNVAQADEWLVRATRESESCLYDDANQSYDEALSLLGANPHALRRPKQICFRHNQKVQKS